MRRATAQVVLIAAACASTDGRAGIDVLERDSAAVVLVDIRGDANALPVLDLTGAAAFEIRGEAAPHLGSVGEVELLSDGRVLVEDNQTRELHLFAANGELQSLVGRSGEGPGEFQNVTELSLAAGDTAYAYDRRLDRITAIGPDGRYTRTLSVPHEDGGFAAFALDAWAIDAGHLLLHRTGAYDTTSTLPHPRRDTRDAVLTVLDREGRTLAGPVRFTGGYSVEFERGDAGAPFSNQPAIAAGSGRVVWSDALTYQLFVAGPDLEPQRVIRWAGWEAPLGEAEIREVRDSMDAALAPLRAQRPDMARDLLEAVFAPAVLPALRPAIGPILLDERGRIWVSAFRPTTRAWDQRDAWHLLEAAGRPIARALLPERAKLAAVRHDRIALIVRDSLDVEHIRVVRLEGAGSLR